MFFYPKRVSVSNIDILRCTQQAHVKIFQKFKICSKSHYFTLWAKKCATCVHIKKNFVSHPNISHVFQNQFWYAGSIFRPSYDPSKLENAQKTTSKKSFIYDAATKVGFYFYTSCKKLVGILAHVYRS